MITRNQVFAAGVWCLLATIALCASAALVAMLAGCAPRAPDPGLVLWEQPSPEIAARAHAREKGLVPLRIVGTSMEPLFVGGDWLVLDAQSPWSKLEPGHVIAYVPDWTGDLVAHACAEKSGDGWIVHGINNAHYERGAQIVLPRHYRGRVVQAYTKRAKP